MRDYGRAVRELRLVPSSGGAFEVTVDGRRVWSKKETRAFPEVRELKAQIRASARG